MKSLITLSSARGYCPRSGSTLVGVLTLLSALMFVALLVMQYLEWKHYGSGPSIWPT